MNKKAEPLTEEEIDWHIQCWMGMDDPNARWLATIRTLQAESEMRFKRMEFEAEQHAKVCVERDDIQAENKRLREAWADLEKKAADRREGAYETARQDSVEGNKVAEEASLARYNLWANIEGLARDALAGEKTA